MVLVAGVGNIFLGDDGFGPAVARRLAAESAAGTRPAPAGVHVRVVDYGIRGMHLAYDLLEGVDALVLIDALPASSDGRSPPGSLQVLRIRPEHLSRPEQHNQGAPEQPGSPAAVDPSGPGLQTGGPSAVDPHAMDPLAMLRHLGRLGGTLPRTYLVGCVAAQVGDGIGLSAEASGAVPAAVDAVRELLLRESARNHSLQDHNAKE